MHMDGWEMFRTDPLKGERKRGILMLPMTEQFSLRTEHSSLDVHRNRLIKVDVIIFCINNSTLNSEI